MDGGFGLCLKAFCDELLRCVCRDGSYDMETDLSPMLDNLIQCQLERFLLLQVS